MRRPTGACSARLPDRIRIRIKRWRSRLPKHSDTMMMRCSPANFLGWVIRSGTKPCHKTHCRCPHRLNLSFRSGRSCALPNVKALKDKGLEFANSIWSFVGNKGNPRWLWHAIDHHTGKVLAYVFGRRKDDVFLQLKGLLEPFGLTRFYPYSDTSRACSSSTRICGGAIGCFPSLLTTAKP
jgi:hypothetical protein